MKNLLLILTICFAGKVVAQESSAFTHLDMSLRLSTMGVGVEAITPFNKSFDGRIGFNFITLKTRDHTVKIKDIDDKIESAFGYLPTLRLEEKLSLVHGHLLADFYPNPQGIFHITAGVFIGTTDIKVRGFLADKLNEPAVLLPGNDWPELKWKDHVIEAHEGKVDLDLQMGNEIKPYLGIGLRHRFPKSKLGLKFEAGALYQGNYTVMQNGKILEVNENDMDNFKDFLDYTRWFKWWPMLNIQITYQFL